IGVVILSQLKAQGLDSWHFQLDNPTLLGWSVVAFYGLAALACAVAAVLSRSGGLGGSPPGRGECNGRVWWALAAGLTFLAINKQLNFQTLLIVVMRRAAASEGWWGHRRTVQLAFSVVFGFSLGLVLTQAAARHRDFFQTNRRAFWGVI